MDPLSMAMLGGALGVAKSELFDRPREERERKYQAVVARYSPWTGMTPTPPKEADPMGSALQGGMAGASFGQNMQLTNNQNDLMKAQLAALNGQNNAGASSPWMSMGYGTPNAYSSPYGQFA